MRNRENIGPMIIAVGVEVGAAFALVPRLGLFGVGLAVSIMQITLCGLLALRLGLLGEFQRRLIGWVAGGAGAWLGNEVAARVGGPLVLRILATTILVLSGWLLGNWFARPTREDLAALGARLRTAVVRLRMAAATRSALGVGASRSE